MTEEKKPEIKWIPVFCEEKNEQAQCDRCKRIIQSSDVGMQFYCKYCNKYVWREEK